MNLIFTLRFTKSILKTAWLVIVLIFFTIGYGCTSTNPGEELLPTLTHIVSNSTEVSPTATVQMPTASPFFTPTLVKPSITDHPPGGVPAAPNLSLIRAEIVAVTQDKRGTVLTIDVLSSQPQEGFADFGAAVVGKQIEVLLLDNTGIKLSADQIIVGELDYNGDEKGGLYFLSNVSRP